MNTLLDVALSHHSAGCAVIAVRENKKPYREGWNEYFTREQTEAEVKEHFSNGAYGVAMVLWPASPYAVLDFDGIHADEAWRSTGIELPETARSTTRSGGKHLFFKMPSEAPAFKRKVRLVKIECDCKGAEGKPKHCGVDLLVHGYAVIPPTPGYREDPDYPLEDAVLIPPEILALAQEKPKPEERITGDANGRVRDGERNSTACSLAGSMRARGMSLEAIRAGLKADNEKRFDPPLDDKEIENVLKSAAKWEQGTAQGPEHLTDLGNARRLVALHGQDLRYSNQYGWHVWDQRRWEQDNNGAVERYAKTAVRNIYVEAASCDNKENREAIANHAHRSESDARIKSMISLAKSELELVVRHQELDRDPWLLNVNNGTLNLKTGELMPHRREDLITKLIPLDYNPEAVCPTWLCFLDRVTGDNDELISFFQKAVGYSLTANTREQCFFILYGTGANGKSTFLNIVSALLGDYAMQTRTETLLVKRSDQIPNDIARLAGARFVSAVETESGRRLAEGLVKQMTGGDKMTARFLHHEFFEFEPTFKLWLAVNHKPRVVGTDRAVWRRIRLIPFTVTIAESEQDPDLGEKLKEELPGVLAWAVTGCELWRTNGLKPPKAVTAATQEYCDESDVVAAFIDECCEQKPDAQVTKAMLYEAYAEWAKRSGEYASSKKDFGSRLKEKGFSDNRTTEGRFWVGINLCSMTR
jgi:P4 family phage/plasmid primase-like protien